MFSFLLAPMTGTAYTLLLVFKIICYALLFISAIAIILCVMMQQSEQGNGTNVMTGQSESFYAQNKNKTKEGRLKLITIIASIVVLVISIVLTVLVTKM